MIGMILWSVIVTDTWQLSRCNRWIGKQQSIVNTSMRKPIVGKKGKTKESGQQNLWLMYRKSPHCNNWSHFYKNSQAVEHFPKYFAANIKSFLLEKQTASVQKQVLVSRDSRRKLSHCNQTFLFHHNMNSLLKTRERKLGLVQDIRPFVIFDHKKEWIRGKTKKWKLETSVAVSLITITFSPSLVGQGKYLRETPSIIKTHNKHDYNCNHNLLTLKKVYNSFVFLCFMKN